MFNMKHEISAGTKVEDAKALMAASSLKIMADDNLDAAAATVSLFIHQNSEVYIHCFSLYWKAFTKMEIYFFIIIS